MKETTTSVDRSVMGMIERMVSTATKTDPHLFLIAVFDALGRSQRGLHGVTMHLVKEL